MYGRSYRFTLIAVLLLASCVGPRTSSPQSTQRPVSLTVFAAASLAEAFQETGARFEGEHPGVKLSFNFAGSQELAQQLAQGAAGDVFASANQKQMDAAVAAGRIVTDAPKVFAANRLVVIFPADNPAHIATLADLTRPGLKLVLAAMQVPAGQYALDFLEKSSEPSAFGAGYKEEVLKNVVSYEENVRAVLSKVALGEADAGIVYTSDVSAGSAGEVGVLEIPDALNSPASYVIAPVSYSEQAELAAAFIDFVLSPAGQDILGGYGFLPARR